jgi:hypothetical protein
MSAKIYLTPPAMNQVLRVVCKLCASIQDSKYNTAVDLKWKETLARFKIELERLVSLQLHSLAARLSIRSLN